MKTIYLDNAAATPVRSEVIEAMTKSLQQDYANPSALHGAAQSAKGHIETAREETAKILGVKPREVIFTAGATEANNILLQGVSAAYPNYRILISSLEHDSIASQENVDVCGHDKKGRVTPHDLKAAITDETVLISLILVNNETAALQDMRAVRSCIEAVNAERSKKGVQTPLFLHADGAQAPAVNKIVVSSLKVDALTINGSKIGGPKQSGCLYVSRHLKLLPLYSGGGQERGLRPGTEATHQIAGFLCALKITETERAQENARLTKLRNYFEKELQELGGIIVASDIPRSPHITCALFPGYDNETLAMRLSGRGVYVGIGSACHAGTGASRVLASVGYTDAESRTALRFSYGYSTSKQDLEKVATILTELL